MIIGAQGFTIRDYAQNEADFRETAKKLHDIGYKTLQVSAFGDIDPHIIREICDETGFPSSLRIRTRSSFWRTPKR